MGDDPVEERERWRHCQNLGQRALSGRPVPALLQRAQLVVLLADLKSGRRNQSQDPTSSRLEEKENNFSMIRTTR